MFKTNELSLGYSMEKSQKIGHKKQASNIHQWKPWLKAGVKTKEGKAVVSQNAWKHGRRSKEKIQFLKNFNARSQIIMNEPDPSLGFMWMTELLEEMDDFKLSPEGNLKAISQQTEEKETDDGLEDRVRKAYAQQAREWHEAVAHIKAQLVKKGTSV